MFQISKKSQYGLRAMVFLAKNYKIKKVFSVKMISEQEGIPFSFLEKIICQLADKNLVSAKKGISGGYILAKNPKKITARDVVLALEENKKPVNCFLCKRIKTCLTKSVWQKIEKSLDKTLEKITLAELIK